MNLKTLFLFVGVLLSFMANSQTQINDLTIEFQRDQSAINTATLKHQVVFVLNLSDSTNVNVEQFEIFFGNTDGGSQFFHNSINVSGNNLPENVSLTNSSGTIKINIGSYSGIGVFYASARLKYSDGTYSSIIKYSNAQ